MSLSSKIHQFLFILSLHPHPQRLVVCSCSGSSPSSEQLGELLHGDPDGHGPAGLHHELHHRQEQEQPPGSVLVQLSQRVAREQLCSCRWVARGHRFIIIIIYIYFFLWWCNNNNWKWIIVHTGDDGTSKDAVSTGKLNQENEHIYNLWCSGRVCCEGMLIQLKVKDRVVRACVW